MPDRATVYAPVPFFPGESHLRPLAPGATVSMHPSTAEAELHLPTGARVVLHRIPDAEMGSHLDGLQRYVRAQGGGEGLAARVLSTLSVFGLRVEPHFDEDGHALRFVAALTSATDGLCMLDGEVFDPEGRGLLRARERPSTPDAARTAARALALLCGAFRGLLEDDASSAARATAEALRCELLEWIACRESLARELEIDERAFLETPVGAAEPQDRLDAIWRSEGAAVLLWALGARALPPHDASEHPFELARAAGLLRADVAPPLSAPFLRDAGELEWMRRRLLAIHWRVREHGLRPDVFVDFERLARDAQFGGFETTGIALAEGDLAIAGAPIARCDPASTSMVASIAMERHHAINWLIGAHPIYSRVVTPT